MRKAPPFTINFRGHLFELDVPKVMGILNVTPDSFYNCSRTLSDDAIWTRVKGMIYEGVDIIDVGGCSTRPGAEYPSEDEEWDRIDRGCRIIREISCHIPLSIDTFRSRIARDAIEKWDADIINDISGGKDPDMWPLIAEKKIAYVLTHNRDNGDTDYGDITADVITELSKKINELHKLGINDVIIDPGFGFAKTLKQNFELFDEINEIVRVGCPVLVGISRKSMLYKTLDCSPTECLTGTIALNAIALEKGAHILRVHDVKEAIETVNIFSKLKDHPI